MKFFYAVERELNPDNFSSLIMKVIGAPYSHAFILVKDIPAEERMLFNLPEGDIIFEATVPTYCWRAVSSLNPTVEEIVHQVEIQVRDEKFALGWLLGNMGKEYSFSQCLGFLDIHWNTNLMNIWGNGEGKGVCSEFAARFGAVNSTRPDFFFSVDCESINPRSGLDLFNKLHKLTY